MYVEPQNSPTDKWLYNIFLSQDKAFSVKLIVNAKAI